GFVGADVTDVADGEVVVLERLVPVTLVFELPAGVEPTDDLGVELAVRPVGSDVTWDDPVAIEFDSVPHEAKVMLAGGVEFWVDMDARWSLQRFRVPEGGGRVVLTGTEDDG
ncbi:MAG: hypothetical protein AAFP86_11915, partial [Planctomycetota bacterium]